RGSETENSGSLGEVREASLFTFWSSPTSAQATIDLVPPLVAEGKNVLLLVHNLPENLNIIYWYKGITTTDDYEIARYLLSTNESVEGLAHSRRETIFRNGSLLIENVKQNDTGVYTLQSLDSRGNKKDTSVQLYVHQPVSQPSIRVTNDTVKEKDSVVFTCVSGDSEISIQWIFNNQNLKLTDRMMLSENNSRLSIDPVEGEDAGEYQCEVSNLVSSKKSSSISLIVNSE
uniref:Ig-like domain-containing protein n=1 Tax=Nannospalax galili TaxID=1026970 RepID=A0A8C6S2J1_NANGA